jgi:hypothetical protein
MLLPQQIHCFTSYVDWWKQAYVHLSCVGQNHDVNVGNKFFEFGEI